MCAWPSKETAPLVPGFFNVIGERLDHFCKALWFWKCKELSCRKEPRQPITMLGRVNDVIALCVPLPARGSRQMAEILFSSATLQQPPAHFIQFCSTFGLVGLKAVLKYCKAQINGTNNSKESN